jgi:spermidine synthase
MKIEINETMTIKSHENYLDIYILDNDVQLTLKLSPAEAEMITQSCTDIINHIYRRR